MTDFKNLAQLSSDALLVVAGGNIAYANPAAHLLMAPAGGQSLQDMPVYALWRPNPLDGAWGGDEPLPPATVHLRTGNSREAGVALELTATRDRTPDGPVYYVKASRARAQDDRLAERVRTALALSTDAAMVVDAQSLAFLDANPAACALMGVTPQALRSLSPTHLRRRDGSGTEDFHALYAQLIQRSPQAQTHEYDFLAQDGRTIPIAATRQALNVDGRWLIFITWRDISAQVSAQALVQQFKDAFDQTPNATNIIDVQTLSYVYVNEPFIQMVGLPREQVMAGGPLSMPREIVVVDDLASVLASVVAQHPHTLVSEKTVILPDGRRATFESHLQAVFSGGRWLVRATRVDITQRKLQQQHLRRVMAAVDSAVDAIFIIDPETMGYVEVNEAAAVLFETPRETLRTLRVPDLMARLSTSFSDTQLREHYDTLVDQAPRPMIHETTVLQSDGRRIPVENVRRAVQVNGEWLVVSVMRDITERKTEQARVERLAAVVNMSPDAVMLVDRASMQVIDVNSAACAMHGCTRSEMLAQPVHLTLKDTTQQELAAKYDAVIGQSPAVIHEEVLERRPDGSSFSAEVRRQAIQSAGAWVMVVTVRDLSERKAAHERIERFAAIVNLSAEAVFVVDRESMVILDVNESACRMYGYAREDLVGQPVQSITFSYKDTPGRMEAEYDQVIAQSPRATLDEKTARLSNGNTIHAEVQRMALQSNGRWLIVTIVRDISERKAAQARQELLTAAIEAAPDGIAVVDPVTLQYLHVNDAVCRTHAASREQLMTLGVDGIFRGQIEPDAIRAIYQSVIDSYPGATSEERAIVALDGSTAYYEAVRRAVQVDGRWLIVSMNRDITERKAAQARMQTLIEAFNVAPDPIVVVDPQTMMYVDVNEAATRLVGRSRDDMLARGLRGVFPQEQAQDGLQDVYQEAIDAAPDIVTRERTVFDAQGSPRILEGTRRAARIDGRWLVVSVTRDITERKAAQERVERFAAMINLSADAVFVVDHKTLRIIDVNEAACRMYRCSREELLSRTANQNRPGMSAEEAAAMYDETIARSPEVFYNEHEGVRADGSVFQAETHRLALQSAGGWLILATVRDITDRKRAESEIRQRVAELELLREAYDAAVDAILIADPETLGYHDVNHAAVKLLGVSREDLLARGVEASYYSTAGEPFDAERFRKGSRYVISRAPEALVEVRTVNPLGLGGRDTVIEFSRRGVNINGRWVIVTLMRDITAAHRAEEEIRQRVAELTRSNQELEQFAYVTSHDLSEPLRMVASYTQLLSKRYADKFDDDGREFIKYAVDGAQRMKQLIDDLLMYSRAGRSKVPMRHVRLDRSLDDALANLAHAIGRNDAVVERTPLPELVCEKAGLTQVFQNLVGNAIKFRGDAAPVVRISAVEDEHFWTISVADNGIGISSEYFQRIFVIFQRLHARTKYEGTGIGLSICKKIVERHGGQITVTSEPGQGTTFSFTLSKSLTESESP